MALDCLSVGLLVADHLCDPIDHLPRPGELVLSDRLPLATGGCASNAAMDLARLEASVAVVGCVGRDPFGRFIIEQLEAQNVATHGIRQLDDAWTSGTLIVNVRGKDRRFIHTVGANARLTVDDVSDELLESARVLYLGGFLLLPGITSDGLAELFARARRRGVTTVLDIVVPGQGDHLKQLAGPLSETDVFLPNSDEAAVITGSRDPVEQAERFRKAGAATVVITCGDQGAVLISAKERLRSCAYHVPYVGGTGAGDAFDAGYIAGLLAGEPPEGCLRWGSALGASCVRSVSATDSVFNRQEALDFMRNQPLSIERL